MFFFFLSKRNFFNTMDILERGDVKACHIDFIDDREKEKAMGGFGRVEGRYRY